MPQQSDMKKDTKGVQIRKRSQMIAIWDGIIIHIENPKYYIEKHLVSVNAAGYKIKTQKFSVQK